MITSIFLGFVYIAVLIAISPLLLLGDVSLPGDIASAVSTMGGYLQPIDPIIPMATLFEVFSVILIFEAGVLTWEGVNWVLRRIPTQS